MKRDSNKLWTLREIAEAIGYCYRSLYDRRNDGMFKQGQTVGHNVIYTDTEAQEIMKLVGPNPGPGRPRKVVQQ